jgi:hypothetical protein
MHLERLRKVGGGIFFLLIWGCLSSVYLEKNIEESRDGDLRHGNYL